MLNIANIKIGSKDPLTKEQFYKMFKGKINIDIDEAWEQYSPKKKVKKYKPKLKTKGKK